MYARKTVKNNYRKNNVFDLQQPTLRREEGMSKERSIQNTEGAQGVYDPASFGGAEANVASLSEEFGGFFRSDSGEKSPNNEGRRPELFDRRSVEVLESHTISGGSFASAATQKRGGVWTQPNSIGSFASAATQKRGGICKNYSPKDGFSAHRNKYSSTNNCNNCGKPGHLFHQCKMPITSIGIIVFRIRKTSNDESIVEYLLIRRKDTLGYIDFMRGKYSVNNKDYIMNMLKQMTRDEKERLCSHDFNKLWGDIWGNSKYSSQYKSEEIISREKYNMLTKGIWSQPNSSDSEACSGVKLGDFSQLSLRKNHPDADNEYTLLSLIKESDKYDTWEEPEWGFPKGRRNNQENDFDCALREFTEETGYHSNTLTYIQNVLPFEEIFLGSNYKSYKHKYFLMYMDYETTLDMGNYQTSEVSKIEWKSYEDCIACFRPYNLEKIRILTNIHRGIVSRHIVDFSHNIS